MASQGNRDLLLTMKARDDASAQVQRFGNTLSGVNRVALQAAKSMRLFAASVVAHRVGAGLEAIGRAGLRAAKAAFSMATEFDKGMRLVRTQTQQTGRAFRDMQGDALALAKRIPLPMEQISEGLYDILSSMDVNSRQAIRLTEKFAKAAVAGNVDIRSSTRAAIGALNAYSLPLSKANMVLDQQFQLVKYGIGTYEDFIGILGDVYPAAYAADQTLQSVGAALAFTTRNGLSASKAGISVARALDMLTRPQYSTAIKDVLGVDVIDQATGEFKQVNQIITEMAGVIGHLSGPERKNVLADIFGAGEIRAFRFFNIAIPKFKDLNTMFTRFGGKEAAGAMMDAFEIMEKAVGNQVQRLKNHLFAIITVLARNFFPEIRRLLRFGERLLEMFEALPKPVRELAARIFLLGTMFALVGGKILTFTANLMGAQALMLLAEESWGSLIRTTFGTIGKLVLIAAAIGGIVFAIIKLRENWEDVKEWWGRNWERVVGITVAAVAAIGAAILTLRSYLAADAIVSMFPLTRWQALWINMSTAPGVAFHVIRDGLTNLFTGMYVRIDDAIKAISARWAALKASLAAQGGLLEFLGFHANEAIMGIQAAFATMRTKVVAVWRSMLLKMAALWAAFQITVSGGAEGIATAMMSGISRAGAFLSGGFSAIIGRIGAMFSAAGSMIVAALTNPWTYIIAAVAAAVYIIIRNWDKVVNWFKDNFGSVIDVVVDVFNDIKGWVQRNWNEIRAIFSAALKLLVALVKLAFHLIVQPIIASVKIIVGIFSAMWDWLFGESEGKLRPLVDFIVDNWDRIREGIANTAVAVIGIFEFMVDAVFRVAGYMVDGVTRLLGLIPGPIGDAADDVREEYHNLQESILSGLNDMQRGISEWGEGTGNDIRNASQDWIYYREKVAGTKSAITRFVGASSKQLQEWNKNNKEKVDGVAAAFRSLADDAKWTADEVIKAMKKQFKAAQNLQSNFRKAVKRGLNADVAQDLIDTLGDDAPRVFALLANSSRKESGEIIKWIEKTSGASENAYRIKMPDDMNVMKQAFEGAKGAVKGLFDWMKRIPENIKTVIDANTTPAELAVKRWIAALYNTRIEVQVGARMPGTQIPNDRTSHTGGLIPGSSMRDVPRMLQTGEYVVRRSRARRFRPLLELVNRASNQRVMDGMRAMAHNAAPRGLTPAMAGAAPQVSEKHLHFHTVGRLDRNLTRDAVYELHWEELTRGY